MKNGKALCLQTKNHSGAEVIFTEKQRLLKSSTHPELRDPTFILGRLKMAINEPNFIYEDLGKPKMRQAFYHKEYTINGVTRYTKVIVDIKSNPFFVVTAFRPNYVKERAKTKLIYGKDE